MHHTVNMQKKKKKKNKDCGIERMNYYRKFARRSICLRHRKDWPYSECSKADFIVDIITSIAPHPAAASTHDPCFHSFKMAEPLTFFVVAPKMRKGNHFLINTRQGREEASCWKCLSHLSRDRGVNPLLHRRGSRGLKCFVLWSLQLIKSFCLQALY